MLVPSDYPIRQVAPFAAVAALLVVTSLHAGELPRDVAEAIPVKKVVAEAQDQLQGRILAVELQQPAERYAVRMLDGDGQHWRLVFDSRSGDMMRAARVEQGSEPSHRPAAFFGRRTPQGYPEW